jgi:hypothetical protein
MVCISRAVAGKISALGHNKRCCYRNRVETGAPCQSPVCP